MRVLGFVGSSGTGKSYRAQMVASENKISYIIDDGLLINENKVVAGTSAKRAATKIETVKHAIFIEKKEKNNMIKAIKKYNPKGILILGTSDDMVKTIAANLELPEVEKIVYIDEVATPTEIQEAQRTRRTQGKHVIPVPTFEVKKDFSGYLLDPLQIFSSNGKGSKVISEKTVIRPTFSYLGKFTISDTVIKQIAEDIAIHTPGIVRIIKTRARSDEAGAIIYMEIVLKSGSNLYDITKRFKEKCTKKIENLTSMNVKSCEIIVKKIELPSKYND